MFYRLISLLLVLFSVTAATSADTAGLGDLLEEGWRAERQGNSSAALKAYSSVLALRPDDPQLNLKIAELLVSKNEVAVGTYLVKALDGFQKDPKCPMDVKIAICSALMGHRPREWRGSNWTDRIYPPPYKALPEAEQKRLSKTFPESYFFPSKADEMLFRIAVGEKDRALQLATDVATSGSWQSLCSDSFTRGISEPIRRDLAKTWMEDGKRKTDLPLMLAALALYSHLSDKQQFKKELPSVLKAVKGDEGSLRSLALLCSEAGWADEEKKVLALCPNRSERDVEYEDFHQLAKLIESGDRADVVVKLRQVLVDYPDSYSRAFDIDNLCNIINRGWNDLLVEFIQPEMVEDVCHGDISSAYIIVSSTVFNQPRFDYWAKLIIPIYANEEGFYESMATFMNRDAAEDRIWFMEQFLKRSPNSHRVRYALANSYLDAGYPNRALPILQQLIRTGNSKSQVDYSGLFRLVWKTGSDLGKLQEVAKDLWEQRDTLQPSASLEIAKKWIQEKNPEEAQKWLDDLYKRVTPESKDLNPGTRYDLWSDRTYGLRLEVLVKLGRKEEVKQLLAEAKTHCPNYAFHENVYGLNSMVDIDWNDEVRRRSEVLKRIDDPASSQNPCGEIVKLAEALVKAGKLSDVRTIATSVLPIHNEWHQGLILAVSMLQGGVKEVVPFVEWVNAVDPTRQDKHNTPVSGVVFVASALRERHDSLARAIVTVAGLLSPEDAISNGLSNPSSYGMPSNEDMDVLVPILSSRKLNSRAMSALTYNMRMSAGTMPKWQADLVASQPMSAYGQIMGLIASASRISQQDLQKILDDLSRQQDWERVDTSGVPSVAGILAKRGMSSQAEKLLSIVVLHANNYERKNLLYALIALSGKPLSGSYETDPVAWTQFALFCRNSERRDEARAAAKKALELAKTPNDKFDPFAILVWLEPDPMSIITSEFHDLTDGPDGRVSSVCELIFRVVEKDHSRASQAVPLLEEAASCSADFAENGWRGLVVAELWAGRNDQAIAMLKSRLDLYYGLGQVVAFLCTTEMSNEVRKSVVQLVDDDLKSSRTELSYLADTFFNKSGMFESGTEGGLVALSEIVLRRVQSSDGVVPVRLLDACVNGLSSLGKRSAEVNAAWYKVTETAIKKAAAKPDDAKTIVDWLRRTVTQLESSRTKNPEVVKQLNALADSLK